MIHVLFISAHVFSLLWNANARHRFLKAINTGRSGGYMCQLHDVALNRYIIDLTDTFKAQSTQNAQGKEAAFSHGRNKDIWVLNDQIQIDKFGNQLAQDETDYVWMGNFMARDCIVPNKYASEMPLDDNALPKVFKSLEKMFR
jgi:hypothetical protein